MTNFVTIFSLLDLDSAQRRVAPLVVSEKSSRYCLLVVGGAGGNDITRCFIA